MKPSMGFSVYAYFMVGNCSSICIWFYHVEFETSGALFLRSRSQWAEIASLSQEFACKINLNCLYFGLVAFKIGFKVKYG